MGTKHAPPVENDSIRCKLGPRQKGRKHKGKVKPQAVRQAKASRSNFLSKVVVK